MRRALLREVREELSTGPAADAALESHADSTGGRMITPLWDDPFTLDGLLARFWKRLACRPDMAPDHRLHLLYLFTYSYGNELRIKQNHRKETRIKWRDLIRFRKAYRFPAECWACQAAPPAHWHHIIPIARGGANRRDNLVPLCKACHRTAHHSAVPAGRAPRGHDDPTVDAEGLTA